MKNMLILFAHQRPEKSRANREPIALIEELLKNDVQKASNLSNHTWNSEQMRKMITQ
jgi:hypothetical protein